MANPVPPLKNDSSEGFEEDFNVNVDSAEVRGLVIQNNSSSDQAVQVTRDAGNNLIFIDPVAGSYTLTMLSTGGGITAAQHRTLRQLIHLAEEGGPFEGFASGAYQETLPSASPFPTSVIWWTSAAKTSKIVEETVTYNSNRTVNTDQWKVYDTDGSTVLATVTDTIAYSGVFETSRTRTIV